MEILKHFLEVQMPGLVAALVVALAAVFLSEHYGAPVMLMALLLGVSMNFLSEQARCQAGIDLCAKQILRMGVALLGLRISFSSVSALGLMPVLMVVLFVFVIIAFGVYLTRNREDGWIFGCLSGGSVAICGASAAMALSSVLPNGPDKERDTVFTVVTVTALSTMAMVIYPLIANWVGLDDQETGVFLGATIHDVAQVVGAGYSVSDTVGDVATIVKLLRVAMLLPVVLLVLAFVRLRYQRNDNEQTRLPFPWFVLGFVVLLGVNSTFHLPQIVTDSAGEVSRWAIVMAVAALGMKTSFGALMKVGWQPVVVILSETVFLAGLCLAVILAFGV